MINYKFINRTLHKVGKYDSMGEGVIYLSPDSFFEITKDVDRSVLTSLSYQHGNRLFQVKASEFLNDSDIVICLDGELYKFKYINEQNELIGD